MPRGYRCILVAFAGWLSLTAQAPYPAANAQQVAVNATGNAAQNVTTANDNEAEWVHREKYEAECDPANEKRDSNLCAQWKAADAAATAAKWTIRSTWVSGIAGILVLFALGFAFEANWISRTTARHQLRAYVSMRQIGRKPEPSVGAITHWIFQFEWTNSGQTPATDVNLMAGHAIGPEPLPNDLDFMPERQGIAAKSVIGPTLSLYSVTQIPIATIVAAVAQGHSIYVYSAADYRDMFGKLRRTEFSQRIFPEGDPNQRSCEWANINSGPFNGMDESCRYPPKENG